MRLSKISQLFSIEYPKTLIFSNQLKDDNGVNFVSSSGKNNGIVGRVAKNNNTTLYPSGVITVPLKGSVLSAFVQPEECYVAHQIAVLTPINTEMPFKEKLFYCQCIRANKYRFNYGRQADRTFRDILVPSPENLPEWVNGDDDRIQDEIEYTKAFHEQNINLYNIAWGQFAYSDLFDVQKGKRVTKLELNVGNTPFIGAIDSNNGYREFCDLKPIFPANTITVPYNGNGVGEAFYQPQPFYASDDINVLIPKFELNRFIAMFIIAIIRKEKYRFNYGRKWHKERMEASTINLPVDESGNPNFEFMELYIKSLPYSKKI